MKKLLLLFSLFLSLTVFSSSLHADLVAEYRFDECDWNSTANEVIDSSGNGYHGIAYDTLPQPAFINNGADFSSDGISDYISLDNRAVDGLEDFTINTWFKTSNQRSQPLLSGANAHQNNELLLWISPTKFTPHIKGKKRILTIPDTTDNKWHMFTWTREADKSCVYIDGTLQQCKDDLPTGALKIDPNGLILGQEQDAVGGRFDPNQNFVGLQDELTIFNYPLLAEEISTLYNHESAHKNYDGSHRMAIDCTTPVLLAEYRFDECRYTGATGEVIDSAGGNNSGTITGNADISKDEKKIGHALHLNGGAVDIDDLAVSTEQYKKNTVMFWMYWDNTDNVMPFGWNTYDLWFNNGDFGFNARKSLIYGINSASIKNGWHHVTAVFTNGDVYSNRLYIDGILKAIEQKKGTLENNNAYATPSARIGGWKRNNHYRFKGYLDELKIYKGEVNATTIASIYNSEKDLIRTITCAQAIFNAVNRNGGCFNWENNITTKIAGDPIALTILAADQGDANSSIQDANITKLELLSFSDPTCDTLYDVTEIWSGNSAVDGNGCWNPTDFIHDKAIRCAKIRISGIFEGNSVESNSTDTFSIRPKTFVLQNIPSGKLTAEHTYTLKAIAVNSDGTTQTADYNTTVTPQANKYLRDGSDGSAMAGTFVPTTDFIFQNGATADTALSFDNVGIVGLDLNDTTWTLTDQDDTLLVDRTIYLERNLTFIPAKFKIDFPTTPLMKNYNDGSFTYYANDLANMHAVLKNLSFTVTALGENDSILTNYQNPQTTYFANNSNFRLRLNIAHNPNLSSDINESTTRDLNFSAGVATLNYNDVYFNFAREHNTTREPLLMQGSDAQLEISIDDSVDTAVTGDKNQTFSDGATFYYGRIITEDLRTAATPAPHKVSFAIYSSSTLSGFERYTQNWYINKEDNFSSWQNAIPTINRKRNSTAQNSAAITNEMNTFEGVKTFDLTANPADQALNAFFHLDIPAWLWYSKYEAYDFGATSSCATHPCFAYIFDHDDLGSGIASGDFKGASFDHNLTSTPKRKAVKLLR
jgi:hypothetical protein